MEEKGILKSKINISGFLLVICSAISDPMFRAYFGDLIPAEWATRMTFIVGWVIIWLRSNGTPNIPLNWKEPLKGSAPS